MFKIVEDKIILNYKNEYKLKEVISLPEYNHYICLIFNPLGKIIDSYFKANNYYYHDEKK